MDVSDVRQRVRVIGEEAVDPGTAHSMQDALYVDVLKAIVASTSDGQARLLAGAALAADAIGFERWYE